MGNAERKDRRSLGALLAAASRMAAPAGPDLGAVYAEAARRAERDSVARLSRARTGWIAAAVACVLVISASLVTLDLLVRRDLEAAARSNVLPWPWSRHALPAMDVLEEVPLELDVGAFVSDVLSPPEL